MVKKKILFISPNLVDFCARDFNILKNRFDVRVIISGGSLPKFLLKLLKGILWADVTFSWFADFYAFMAVLFSKFFRKKSIVVVGGYDVASEPTINYGKMRFPNSRGAKIVKFILRHADKILPFSNFAAEEVLNINQNTNLDMIPLACDTKKFIPGGQKEDLVLTVCYITKGNVLRKGLKTFVESARYLPEVRFILVGPHVDEAIEELKRISPSNVEFIGFVPEEELIRWYQKAKVYCQLSYQEGEGVGGALGEAMACECIPVVSTKAIALQEAVGDCGFYVPYGDVNATVEAIKKALKSSPEFGKRARERMVNLFPMEKREKELSRIINEVVKQK